MSACTGSGATVADGVKAGGPPNGALMITIERKMSGRTSAHQAALEAPKSCPTTALTDVRPSAASRPIMSRTRLRKRKDARSPS